MKLSWSELRRRKVVRVAIAYAIGAWVLLQVGDTLFGLLELPGLAGKALVAALVLGLPVALVLAWVFDITPEGIMKTGAGAAGRGAGGLRVDRHATARGVRGRHAGARGGAERLDRPRGSPRSGPPTA
jgi:hypothetical protein